MPELTLTLSEEEVKTAIAEYVKVQYPNIQVNLKHTDVTIDVDMKYVGMGMTEEQKPMFRSASIKVDNV